MPPDAVIPSPPSPAREWIRLVLAFGMAVSIGLAPFLGTLDIPGFRALLTLFPRLPWDTTQTVIPLSSFLMGVVAVIVQLGMLKKGRRRRVVWILIVLLGAFAVLVITHTLVVRYADIPATREAVSVLVGFDRPESCECVPSLSDSACLRQLTLNPARIETCWGDRRLQIAFLSLAFPYFVVTSMFGVLVGYLPLWKGPRDVGVRATPGARRRGHA